MNLLRLLHLLLLLFLPILTSSSSTLDLSYTTSTLPSTLPPTVTSLSLSNLNLKTVPPLIDDNLLTVDLSNNLLTLPSVLSVFKSEKIEEINLSFNPLFTSPPLKLNVTTSSIKTLNLSNAVTKNPDHLLKFLTNYKTLDSLIISRNDLKTALKLPLVTKHLDISYNPLHITSILKLKFYPECLILDGLKDPSNSVLDLLPKIVKKCSLRSCSLTSKSILKSILLNPNNLTEIDLSCNPLIPPFGSETINLKSLKKGLKKNL
ncbi:hypothetical protein TL16_g08554 [Triparma laevis f. inornata]|uniref:Uncharacterized protein n=1 Tax=Triparma laevis f. inornata TaxID=1714386 RepID=A0A9W7B4Q9_9STRA|nr:hypothetical protein TL16_g08554 [Triparma laevis f. inornata]